MTTVDDPDGVLVAAGTPGLLSFVATAERAQALTAEIDHIRRDLARCERVISQHQRRGRTAAATIKRAAMLRERLAILSADQDAAVNVARIQLRALSPRSPAVAARWEQILSLPASLSRPTEE